MSQAAVARMVPVHRDLIAKIEKACRWPTRQLAQRCDEVLGCDGELVRLWPAVDVERRSERLVRAHQRTSSRLGAALELSGSAPAVHSQPLPITARLPESAFLGTGSVVIVTPIKQEAIRARPVVAVEDVVGAQRLGEVARRLGLSPSFETVPAGGDVDLNRDNLVVICGPRLSSVVAAVLATDRHLSFVQAPDGPWTLHEHATGRTFRSGQDQRPESSWDVAYLGRLTRPDGGGKVMIFTGIHPQGSLGVVQLITGQLTDLYREIGESCFSVLVGTRYDQATGEPLSVELLSSIHRWGGD